MKKIYDFLKILFGADIGLFVVYALYEVLRYKTHPEFYALTSAPWYTGILLYGTVAGFIAVVLGVTILILRKKLNK